MAAAAAAGAVGAVAASRGTLAGGLFWGVVAGVVLGFSAWWWSDRALRRVAAQLRRWLDDDTATGSVVIPASGGLRELVTVLNDVGERFTDQRDALTIDQPWRHELVHSLVSPAVLFDSSGHLVAANRSARTLLSMRDDAGGRTTVIQALGSAVLADAVSRALVQRELVEVEAELGDRLVHASVAIVGEETLVIVTDRTRERRVEELRRDFVVNASHELKTPATAIQTLSEALEITATRDPAKVPDLVARLREASERLVRLVHDLLNLRRLEDREEFETQPVDLVELRDPGCRPRLERTRRDRVHANALRPELVGREDEDRRWRGIGHIDHPQVPPSLRLAHRHTSAAMAAAILQRPSEHVFHLALIDVMAIDVRSSCFRIQVVAGDHERIVPGQPAGHNPRARDRQPPSVQQCPSGVRSGASRDA